MQTSKARPQWVDYVQRTRQTYLGTLSLTETYRSALSHIYSTIAPTEYPPLGIFPIAHEDQTAFIVRKDPDAALFFDVGQAAILKSAFAALRCANAQQTLFKLLLGAASLKISPSDRFLADKLGDAQSGPYDGPPQVDPATLASVRGTLAHYLRPALQGMFDTIVDGTIVAHELYHYRTQRSLVIEEVERSVAAIFEESVRVATTRTGPLGVAEQSHRQVEKRERELQEKQKYCMKERRMISEEMSCDFYAFVCVATILLASAPTIEGKIALIAGLAGAHSIAFNLHLLHLAFTERATLFADGRHNDDLPGSMSLYNLRRIAISALSANWCANAAQELQSSSRHHSSEYFQVLQNRIYIEMSNDFLMPLIPMLKNCFALVDRTFPREFRPVTAPTENATERLFFSSLAFTLNSAVVDGMLATGMAGLQRRVLPLVN